MPHPIPPLTRRSFLPLAAAALGAGCGSEPSPRKQAARRPPRILVRACWRTGDAGDLASASGLLRLVHLNIPRVEITIWPQALDEAGRNLLARVNPDVKIVTDAGALEPALASADFFLHGSGPGPVGAADVEAWRKRGRKPYGFLGITLEQKTVAEHKSLFDGAAFVYGRERVSARNLQAAGLPGERIGYVPDAAFSFRVPEDAQPKLSPPASALESKKFLAVVPRQNSALLRDTIAAWVRGTGTKVLLCSETETGLKAVEPLYAALPAEVKTRTVRRKTLALPDEAAAVYGRALAVLSEEYYSPILASGSDTPGLYLQPADAGIQGQIWDDVGLKRWLFDPAHATADTIWQALKSIHEHYTSVQVDVHEAVIGARRLQTVAMDRLRKIAEDAQV